MSDNISTMLLGEQVDALVRMAGEGLDTERGDVDITSARVRANVQRVLSAIRSPGRWGSVATIMAVELAMSIKPTVEMVREYPEFWISGPGAAVASRVRCRHDYFLTASCPGCDSELPPS